MTPPHDTTGRRNGRVPSTRARGRKATRDSAPTRDSATTEDTVTTQTQAQIIPLHADESGGRTRWRLGTGGNGGPAAADSGPASVSSGPDPARTARAGGSADSPQEPDATTAQPGWEQTLAEVLEFLRRRLAGEYPVDDFGFDADLTDNVLLPALRPLYRKWFRVETIGMHHVPAERRRARGRQPLRHGSARPSDDGGGAARRSPGAVATCACSAPI